MFIKAVEKITTAKHNSLEKLLEFQIKALEFNNLANLTHSSLLR
jgi:hypothetical protein